MELRAGVIGLGVGRNHVSAYLGSEGVRLVAVAELDAQLLGRFSPASVREYASGHEMLEREDLDIVSICTPPRSHAELTIRALENGVSVLCEKPMAPTLEDCDRMIRSAARAGLTLMIGFKKRFEPAYEILRSGIEGDFGLPYLSNYVYVCAGSVRKAWFWDEGDGGGPIVENTVHAVDILRHLLGDVDRVYAEGDSNLAREAGIDQIDSAIFTMRFRNRSMAGICAGSWARGPEFERPRLVRISSYETRAEARHEIGEVDPFKDQAEHFAGCVRGGREPAATGDDGRKALEVSLAVKESARTGLPIRIGSSHA
jgi:predicted dehydrogenase